MTNIYFFVRFNAFLIFICCLSVTLFAQAERGKINGKVIDFTTNQVVDFAAVSLIKLGTTDPIKSTMTEKGGRFNFSNLSNGNYQIKISFIGYVSKIIEDFELTPENPDKDLGFITLEPGAKMLNEVIVTVAKPAIEYEADKITFNVAQSLMAEGSVASELLKNVPLVNVDIDGKPTIAGKSNTRIFIDGKPSDFMTSNITDLLNVLPSDAIEKIEVLTNPPVKYSADGEGIINIVLKKGYKIGLNGNLSITGGTIGNYNGNGQVAYRNDSLSLTSNYGFRNSNSISSSSSLRENFFKDTTFHRNQYNNGKNFNQGHNFRTAVDWDINKNQNLRFSTNLNSNNSKGNSLSDNHELDEGLIEQKLRKQRTETENSTFNYVVNADYSLKINQKNERLELGMNYNGNTSNQDRLFSRTDFGPTGLPTSTLPNSQLNDSEVINKGFEFKADYDKPLKNKGGLELGLQASVRKNDNDLIVEKNQILNTDLTNHFIFNENIYAAYASYNLRTKNRWSFRAGTRTELTDVNFKQTKSANNNLKPYINLFPNLSINKLFKKKYNMGLSYNMRINRPRDFALNPQIDNADTTNIFFGNPNLKPSFTHQVEMSLSTYGNKWSISPRASYAKSVRIIERIRTIDTIGTTKGNAKTTYQNLAASESFIFSLSGNYRPSKKITTSGGFTFSQVYYESKANSLANRNGLSFRSNAGLSMQLPKKTAFEGNLSYFNNTSAQGRNKGSISTSFGGRKSFLKNKLNVRVMATNPFSQQNNTEFTEGANFKQERYSTISSRNFSLTLNYRFTKVGRNTVNTQKKERPEDRVE